MTVKLVKRKKEPVSYLDGGEGFIKWCEDFVYIKIYLDGVSFWCKMSDLPDKKNPRTGRSSRDMWESQKSIARQCLKMVKGRFLYRLICFCWMRGEGKSLFVCLIQLWKFFNFPSQQIMLGANSKDQVKFVHFDIMRDIILNSPVLLTIVGKRNVQEKEIRLRNRAGDVVSIIRSISSFSGIVSNITGYTFSEIFDMKNPKFFTQLDGSIRNIPNALGVIDSTVSAKDHILYNLYKTALNGLDPTLFFSHKQSLKGDYRDYTNPEMTQEQLNSYRAKFPSREFAMYFKNTWDAGSKKMFPEEAIVAMKYLGVGNSLGEYTRMSNIIRRHLRIVAEKPPGVEDDEVVPIEMAGEMGQLLPVENIYNLSTAHYQPRKITFDELETLSEVYDTNFALLAGVDRADPMKADITKGARTIVTLTAKGLPGSRSNPYVGMENDVPNFIYFVVDMRQVPFNDLDSIKEILEDYILTYDSIESLCAERWGMWDMETWCEDKEVVFTAVSPSYYLQKTGFSELYVLITTGRYKCPEIMIRGTRYDDIFVEELTIFDHDPARKVYGSPEKNETDGIQDDAVYSGMLGVYGGRVLSVEDFKPRKLVNSFGEYYEDKSQLIGDYKK